MASATALAKTNKTLREKDRSAKREALGAVAGQGAAVGIGLAENAGMPVSFSKYNIPVKPVIASALVFAGLLSRGMLSRSLIEAGKAVGHCYGYAATKGRSFVAG